MPCHCRQCHVRDCATTYTSLGHDKAARRGLAAAVPRCRPPCPFLPPRQHHHYHHHHHHESALSGRTLDWPGMVPVLWFALAGGVIAAAIAECPAGWQRSDQGKCYWLTPFQDDWKSADGVCYAVHPGARLVSIQDMLENAFVAERVAAGRTVWIGFWRRYDSGDWEWADGSPANWTNWCEGQPQGGGQIFGYISSNSDTGCWTSHDDTGYAHVICEAPDAA